MSRAPVNHQKKIIQPESSPYQATTISVSKSRPQYPPHHQFRSSKRHQRTQNHYYHPNHRAPHTPLDIGFSDATTTDTCYDFCEQESSRNYRRDNRNAFSDDSGSTRLPYYEFDQESNNGYSRNSFSEYSIRQSIRYNYKDNDDERLYHEIETPCDNGAAVAHAPVAANGNRTVASRLSDRPQSSMSSALTSGMVYGCGGKCQTCESVCYFVLQLVFTMGVLIGMSLCIAGLVLRRSAARNLQVLVYIGIMLAMVSGVLLTIQCRAKNTARRRIKAIQSAKRAPIPMENLINIRTNPVNNLERLPSVRDPSANQ
ncbi:hypothetical protein ABEB36_008865 [Hypothenemus hampei]|uniref:Uncharacterized protein n=1 Tax=Hypothenemus hampei TaxID=57062 RepID=A0ABD1ENC0_HYPHA